MKRGDHLGGGRYSLLDELGRGGMGVVWLAEDKTIGRRVAIKELRLPDGIAPHERLVFEERVLREARTAGRLNDPGIVTVYDVLQELGSTYIVMELVEFPDLADVVKQHGALSSAFVAKMGEQLLSALETAHAAGVVHRDVKPANVMVAPNGKVKLTDFGIAQSTEDPRLTSSGTLIGSPTYISPERLLGHDASPASDLWALGATLFFAAEGYGAYERPTTVATIQAIMHERAQVRLATGSLGEVIMGLLEPAPERRLNAFQARHLLELARAAGGATADQQLTVPPPPPAQGQPSRGTLQMGPASQTAPPATKSKRGIAIIGAVVAVLVVAAVLVFATDIFKSSTTSPPVSTTTTSGKPKPPDITTLPDRETEDTKTSDKDDPYPDITDISGVNSAISDILGTGY